MDFTKLTEKVQEGLRSAQSIALQNSHQQVDVEHLLLALLSQDGGVATSLVRRSGADPQAFTSRLRLEIEKLPKVSSSTNAGMDQVYVTSHLFDAWHLLRHQPELW